ncbi:MAG: hypothetical protein LQ342_001630 [Letrouitia transgressa]|nr:MAG: hypothetical protein LQ342_001630 [Letrouitia transgressa]
MVEQDSEGSVPNLSVKEASGSSLFVRSLPSTVTSDTLTRFFSNSYPVRHATVVTDPATKESRHFGFVTLTDPADANQAIQTFNGTQLEGKKIKVEHAERRFRGPEKSQQTSHGDLRKSRSSNEHSQTFAREPSKLIVRNLPWAINEPAQLAALFSNYGEVRHAIIPRKNKGIATGFGFVIIKGHRNAEKAMHAVNGKEIEGRTLAVDFAVDKEVWQASLNVNDQADSQRPESGSAEGFSGTTALDAAQSRSNRGGPEPLQPEIQPGFSQLEKHAVQSNSSKTASHFDPSLTLFIRNLPFTVTNETLYQHFISFGALRYARVVIDPLTNRSKGTGFVCFVNRGDAASCLQNAPKLTSTSATGERNQKRPENQLKVKSVLEDSKLDQSGRYTLEGRSLHISQAVDKGEARRLTLIGHDIRTQRDTDHRRLYLLSEGTIDSSSPAYQRLSPAEIRLREASLKQRQHLIKVNPSLRLSLTRLSVRNIPRSVTSKDLKALARQAVVDFSHDVKSEARTPLSKEELQRGGSDMREAERSRKSKGKGIVRQAKIIFENREGSKVPEMSRAGKSRGYGFIEYTSHRWALMGLRSLNGHPISPSQAQSREGSSSQSRTTERTKRLIVEFAIENVQVMRQREAREANSRERLKNNLHHQDSGDINPDSSHQSAMNSMAKENRKRKLPFIEERQDEFLTDKVRADRVNAEATDRLIQRRKLLKNKRKR